MVKRPGGVISLQGPRPQPLSLPAAAAAAVRPSKRPRGDDDGAPGPVIVYERTPKVIHARPDEFKALVQRLTGRQQPVDPAAETTTTTMALLPQDKEAATTTTAGDTLVLTLGKQEPPQQFHDDHYTPAALQLPSPGLVLWLLISFSPRARAASLFSPATMRAIQELIS